MDVVMEHRASWWLFLTTRYYRRLRVLVSCRGCGLEEWGLTVGLARRDMARHHTPAECEEWAKEREAEAARGEAAWSAYLADEEAWRRSVLSRFSDSPVESTGGGQ